jgi:hypothetical protein
LSTGGTTDVDAEVSDADAGVSDSGGAAGTCLADADAAAAGDPEADRRGVGDTAALLGGTVVDRWVCGAAMEPPSTMSEFPLL